MISDFFTSSDKKSYDSNLQIEICVKGIKKFCIKKLHTYKLMKEKNQLL